MTEPNSDNVTRYVILASYRALSLLPIRPACSRCMVHRSATVNSWISSKPMRDVPQIMPIFGNDPLILVWKFLRYSEDEGGYVLVCFYSHRVSYNSTYLQWITWYNRRDRFKFTSYTGVIRDGRLLSKNVFVSSRKRGFEPRLYHVFLCLEDTLHPHRESK